MSFFKATKIWSIIFIFSVLFAIVAGFLNQSVTPQGNQVTTTQTPPAVVGIQNGFKVNSYLPLGVEPVTTQAELHITMNKDLGATNADIKLTPDSPLKITVKGAEVSALPTKPLAVNTKYTATLYINKGKFFEWNFTTLGSIISQNEAVILDQIKAKMPYQGEKFRITYSPLTDQFTVTIDTKPADSYFQKALDWFKSQGVTNTNSLKIEKFLVGQAAQR